MIECCHGGDEIKQNMFLDHLDLVDEICSSKESSVDFKGIFIWNLVVMSQVMDYSKGEFPLHPHQLICVHNQDIYFA